ncbi:hypothetical protein GGU11DRAFT_154792 [Lentinula aff. detonsa]|nr:hypothetical protein GGU11DRAFT_154792 [Lentinula aff. detonsa]
MIFCTHRAQHLVNIGVQYTQFFFFFFFSHFIRLCVFAYVSEYSTCVRLLYFVLLPSSFSFQLRVTPKGSLWVTSFCSFVLCAGVLDCLCPHLTTVCYCGKVVSDYVNIF